MSVLKMIRPKPDLDDLQYCVASYPATKSDVNENIDPSRSPQEVLERGTSA